jgi:hypothetical protein
MLKALDIHSTIDVESVRPIPAAFFRNAVDMSFRDMSFVVLKTLLGDQIDSGRLKTTIDKSLLDSHPFSPQADAAFVAQLTADCRPQGRVLVCVASPADEVLVDELRRRGVDVVVLVAKHSSARRADDVLEVQGSAADCFRIADELRGSVELCSLRCPAAEAVRVATVTYGFTVVPDAPQGDFTVESQQIVDAIEIAKRLGLRCGTPHVAERPQARKPHEAQVQLQTNRTGVVRRVAPTASAVRQQIMSL